MFNEPDEKFYIVDVDKLYVSSPVRINEPENFGSIRLFMDGKIENRGGMDFEFGDKESQIGFDRVTYKGTDEPQTESGFSVIENVMDLAGSDANLELRYYYQGNVRYIGAIIPSSIDEGLTKGKFFRVKKINYGDKLVTRFDTEIDIESDQDLDGNTIAPHSTINIPMHSKKVYEEGIHNVLDPEEFDAGPSLGTGITYNAGLLWGISAFNEIEKSYDNMQALSDFAIFSDESIANDDDRYALKNPLVEQELYAYKASGNNDVIQLSMRHVFEITLDTTGVTGGGSTGPGDEIRSYRVVIWVINRVGDTVTFKEEIEQVVASTTLNVSSHNPTVDFTFSEEITLDAGDEIYYAYMYALGGSISWPNFQFDVMTTQGTEGYFIIESVSSELPSQCRVMNIFDAINACLQKVVGSSGVGEMKQYISQDSGTLVTGEYIDGQTSNASGLIYQKSGPVLIIIECEGTFVSGEEIVGRNSSATGTILHFSSGQWQNGYGESTIHVMLDAPILENADCALISATTDACGGLNYVSNVFAVRDFIEPEYNANKYYKEDDKVRYEGAVYRYINGTIASGNLPTNATYWELTTGRSIKTSLQKLLGFATLRYGLGMSVIKEKGSGFGTDTSQRITKMKLDKMSNFFADKEIMTLSDVISVRRSMNTEIIHNKIKSGYSLYSQPNERDSLNAFLTQRNDLTPIEKDDNPLEMVADVLVDGNEIERFRRLKFSESPNEADAKDDDTVIIKCQRFNSSNPISYLNDEQFAFADITNGKFVQMQTYPSTLQKYVILHGFFFADQISVGDEITITGIPLNLDGTPLGSSDTETFEIDSIVYLPGSSPFSFQSAVVIETSDTFSFANYIVQDYQVYFDVDLIMPQRSEGFSNIKETVDQYTEYNIDHVVSNFLINNFPWYGSGLIKKSGDKKIKFTSGKSNVFFQKEYDSDTCEPSDEIVVENQDFTLSKMRTWNSEIFGMWEYTIECKMSYSVFERFREALINESDEDINNGWVYLPFGVDQTLIKVFCIQVEYSPRNNRVNIVAWEKRTQ